MLLSPGVVLFTLTNKGIADFFGSEKSGYEESEFVADVSCVFSPSRLRIEIWATVGVISSSCWLQFGGNAPSCLLTVGVCSANRKHIELAAALVHVEPVGK